MEPCLGLDRPRVGGLGLCGRGERAEHLALPCLLNELHCLFCILACKATQVHRLLHDVEVFIERKGYICVTVPLGAPEWETQRGALISTP